MYHRCGNALNTEDRERLHRRDDWNRRKHETGMTGVLVNNIKIKYKLIPLLCIRRHDSYSVSMSCNYYSLQLVWPWHDLEMTLYTRKVNKKNYSSISSNSRLCDLYWCTWRWICLSGCWDIFLCAKAYITIFITLHNIISRKICNVEHFILKHTQKSKEQCG